MSTVTKSVEQRNAEGSGRDAAPDGGPGKGPESAGSPLPEMAVVAPLHREEPDWPWITKIGPLRDCRFNRIFIQNTLNWLPKASRVYQQWQYQRAIARVSSAALVFLFSTDIGIGMTRGISRLTGRQPRRVYVGFTQDGPWSEQRIARVASGLQRCDAVTVFTEEERQAYVPRYGLPRERVHVIPLHTDEPSGYDHYDGPSPYEQPYILSLGSPNRRFTPVAEVCKAMGVRLVIMTRPSHRNDSLDELTELGAIVITDADKKRALTCLKHARAAVMMFDDPSLPGGFTTLVHGMFLRTPFIVGECLGMREHVIDGETGFVIPHNDTNALGEAIETLTRDEALATRFSQKSYERAEARHSLAAAADAFYRLAHDVLRGE